MRILIAEDDATSRRILEAVLIKWGYDIVSVSLTDPKNAEAAREEAVQIYRKNVIMNLLYSLK